MAVSHTTPTSWLLVDGHVVGALIVVATRVEHVARRSLLLLIKVEDFDDICLLAVTLTS